MDLHKIFEILAYTIPSIVTAAVAYYFFKLHTDNEEGRRRYLLHKDIQLETLPLRLQAYERVTLFLERIDPSKMLVRVAPISDDKKDYEEYIIAQIEQEFEHNLTQQVYLSEKCWSIVVTAKNATIQMLRITNLEPEVRNANDLRSQMLKDLFDNPTPSSTALAYIRSEVQTLLG